MPDKPSADATHFFRQRIQEAEGRGDGAAAQSLRQQLDALQQRLEKLQAEKRAAFERKDFETCKRILQEMDAASSEAIAGAAASGKPGAAAGAAADEDAELAMAIALSKGDDGGAAPAAAAAPAPAAADEDADAELAKAIAMSMGEKGEQEDADDDALPQLQSVDFERWDQDVKIDAETMRLIEAHHSVEDPFVDSQFPPTARSLYLDPLDAKRWKCSTCGTSNPNPEPQKPPTSQEEAIRQQIAQDSIRCTKCQRPPVHVQMMSITSMRPYTWLRPGERCNICEQVWGARAVMMGATDGGKELVSKMCTHYLRDPTTQCVFGTPWKIIRSETRPDDVLQGGLANCWWGGAVACVAKQSWLIERLFVTKNFNPLGVYHVRLFHCGMWRDMLIDDCLPCTKTWEGREDGTTIYYSTGGVPTFGLPKRRSLWVPLLEKASAKLAGCFGALAFGRTAESLNQLTGFPCAEYLLKLPPAVLERQRERERQRAEMRTQLLLQGRDPDELPPSLSEEDLDATDPDVLWSRLLSFVDADFLLSAGCRATEEFSRDTLRDKYGLQSPHSYSVLDVRLVQTAGKTVRLVHIRNPWGERAPRTWQGDWGPDDHKNWTHQLKRQLKVVTATGEMMDDPKSVFWMSFDDFRKFFGSVTVCRVRSGWHENSADAWLPSEFGPGECWELTVFTKTRVDFAVYQESHRVREAALHAKSTALDIGVVVLRSKGGAKDAEEWECYHKDWYVRRERDATVSSDGAVLLEGGYVYRVVPVCLGQMQAATVPATLRRSRLVVHSDKAVEIAKADSSWRCFSQALHAAARCCSRPVKLGDGVRYWVLSDKAGLVLALENAGPTPKVVQWDCGDALGVASTRPGSAFTGLCHAPPRTRQILAGLAVTGDHVQYSCAVEAVPATEHTIACTSPNLNLHQEMPLTEVAAGTAAAPPDPEIVARAPPELQRHQSRSGALDDEEEVKRAMALSLEVAGGSPSKGDDADLQAALRLSQEISGGGSQSAAAPAAAAGMSEEDEELRRALAMSMHDPENTAPPAPAPAGAEDDDPELAAALRMSLQQ
eukprot:TRINITY_DN60233_c0_g1_i1.p1 TRINITY_DN60233_c0_g1~~TRINITY_DN60233_c0_g1_i1.p1  ORF type:complete len:1058 (+),score=271.55 TRINITY_DN60233_c0_g1_i1:115-3288(+)